MADQNTSHDNAIAWLILLAIAAALLALFWYFFEYEVKSLFRWIRWSEMWLISWFVDRGFIVPWNDYELNFYEWFEGTPDIPSSRLDGRTLSIIATVPMEPLRLPLAVILAAMGLWCLLAGPGTQFRRKFNLDGLLKAQSNTFPIISPFARFNPADQKPRPPGSPVPAELPPFAEALGPEEWIAYNQVPVPDGKLDEQATYVAFSRQLGGRWRGPWKLDDYKQILLAAFCLKASRKRAQSDDFLGRLAQCWNSKSGIDLKADKKLLKEARRVLKDRKLAESVLRKCNQHGFETTALMRGLATAREEGGVLAPAQFVWLRAQDRNLWYPLNNLGRQSFHMEALGAMAHYKAEKRTRRPIPKPKVQEAVESITEYMSSSRSRPVPQLDYSGSKRRGVKKAT